VLNELDCLAPFCDVDKSKADAYSTKYRLPGYTSKEELIQKQRLDAVTICTPASTHFSIASKPLAAGLNTFVEKPFATSASDAEKLIEEARSANRMVAVGFIERFNPPISELKRMIPRKELGELLLLEFHRENKRGENILDVGIVKDASVHDIDTACWLFDSAPKVVFARVGSAFAPQKNEDFATIMLGFAGQKTAFLVTNWVTPNRVRTLSAVFTGGVVDVDFVTQSTSIHQGGETRVPTRPFQEPLMLEMREFVSAVADQRRPIVTGEDGLRAIRVAEAILASSGSGAPIYLG
jgi:UDP-N-acetylglucosamine 3-dehydrogenase